ncbi:MAG: Lrp/AsnC family transcriptional regulator [Clostridia bacterium]|nr:Lrp/AsnC family transcriptional regulator [Clostridia bacterium]
MADIETQIINLLKKDSRLTHAEIAKMLNVEVDEVIKIVTDLENRGVIVKYTTIINTEKISEEYIDALIEVKVTPQARSGFDKMAAEISNFPEVKAVYLVSGTYDLAITLECKTARDISLFVSDKLASIECVVGTTTHFIMKQYKESGVIMNKDNDKKRMIIHE